MSHTVPNPWNFGNNDKCTRSPDKMHRLVYYDLGEFAMGSPLAGTCYLESNDKRKFEIGWCGGPPVWDFSGQRVAVPIWTPQRFQRLGVLDVMTKELTVFSGPFSSVLHLRSFNNNLIDMDHSIHFDIRKETPESVTQLVG